MTERLFEKDPTLTACRAAVLSCVSAEDGFDVVLDRTVLFPEGGGQLCDKGTVNGVPALHVREQDGTVVHRLAEALTPGSEVEVLLDAEYRAENSRQHTGEHMLSFAFWKLFGAKNVGFHMNERVITIDLDRELTPEQFTAAEDHANREIRQDKPVEILYRQDNDLADLPMRKTTEKVSGLLRVVVIPDGDACTCCGTHVIRTGEVGLIKILKAERHRGGMRIEAACGERALQALRRDHEVVASLMGLLSTGEEDIVPAVERLKDDLRESGVKLGRTTARLMDYLAAETLAAGTEKNGVTVLCVPLEGGQQEAKQLMNRLLSGEGRLAAVLWPDGERLGYMTARSAGVKLSCREVSALINALFNGKGGGRDDLCQGSGKLTRDWKDLTGLLQESILKMI